MGGRRGLSPAAVGGGMVAVVLLYVAYSFHTGVTSTVNSSPSTASTGGDPDLTIKLVSTDMHSHTTESDGDRTAEEQIDMAVAQGMKHLWITDHDMIRDLGRTREIQTFAKKKGLSVSFGVEITVGWLKKEHHLLGYFPDDVWAGSLSRDMKALQKACAKVKSSRENRNNMMVKWLNERLSDPDKGAIYFTDPASQSSFSPLTVNAVAAWARTNANLLEPSSLGRPHFRAYLIKVCGVRSDLIFGPRAGDGVATVTADAAYFDGDRDGKTGVEREALMHSATLDKRHIVFEPLPIMDGISLINAAGGKAVVAHLPTLGKTWRDKFAANVPALAAGGLWGLEAWSSEISSDDHDFIMALAQTNSLTATGGSDNHGRLKVYAKLGQVHRAGTDPYPAEDEWAKKGENRSSRFRAPKK